ncbi:MAG TPA: hypothetical protein DCW31_07575 [Lactobacillus sp.]|nr:hypothetical protein [Lactobacillus sp.]
MKKVIWSIIVVFLLIAGGMLSYHIFYHPVETAVMNHSAVSSELPANSKSSKIYSSSSQNESSTNISSSNSTYTNAYGHSVVNGQQDNTGEAKRDREHNVDVQNLEYLIRSNLSYNQKMTQMKAWGFTFTSAPPSKIMTIWGRDTSTSSGPIGFIQPDGTIEKK